MSKEAGLSRAGSLAAWVVVSAAADTLRQRWLDQWDPAVLAVGSEAALAAASEDAIVASEAVVALTIVAADFAVEATAAGLATVVVVIALAVTVASVAIAALVVIAASEALTAAPLMRLAGPAVALAVATIDGTAPEAVGMAVTAAAHAHMMTDLVEVSAAATATPGRAAATWSPSGLAARLVGITAAATTTGPETTTIPGSAALRVATKIPESCDATNKTIRRLVVGISSFTVLLLISLVHHLGNEGKPALVVTKHPPVRKKLYATNPAWNPKSSQGNLCIHRIKALQTSYLGVKSGLLGMSIMPGCLSSPEATKQ
jgi:hypothetical protein